MILRPHQEKAIEMLRASLRSGKKRPMLQAAVGFGKTIVAAKITQSALEKGKRVLFVVDAISLIDQTVEKFAANGITNIGVIQGQHMMTDWSRQVQVASVQTLKKRGMPTADLIMIDEAHSQHKWMLDRLAEERWRDVPAIGLSATPWSKGLGNHFDDLLVPCTMQELIDTINPDTGRPYLSPYHVFAPSHPDLSGVRVTAGDYQDDDLARVMGDDTLIGDIVDTWKRKGQGYPTLAFCVNRDHAAAVQERFQAAGIPWGYIDANTDIDERKDIERQLNRGQIMGVANVGCLTKGVDWAVGCIILARPTKSPALAVQMIGRALRVNEGIGDAIILDHSDTVLRLGFPTDIHRTELCTAKKGERTKETQQREPTKPKECPNCTLLMPAGSRQCPSCKEVLRSAGEVSEGRGELVQLSAGRKDEVKAKPKPIDKARFYAELLGYAKLNNKSDSWALANFRERYKEWPHRKNGVEPITPTPQTVSYIRSRQIAYAKSRKGA